MAGVRMELEGAEAALAALGEAAARLEQPKGLYDEIGRLLTVSTQHRFETEKDVDGTPWPKSIRVLTEGGKTMTDTSALAGSITWEASDTGVAVGTNVIYAAIHQLGGTIEAKTPGGLRFAVGGGFAVVQSVTMPKRSFLGLDADDEAEIEAAAQDYILAPFNVMTAAPVGGVNA